MQEYTIHLTNLEMHGYHGWHAEEQIIGTSFKVDIAVSFTAQNDVENLEDTINYVKIYEEVRLVFAHPVKLLETLALNVCNVIRTLDDRIILINISIAKLNPPISNFMGRVGVSLSKSW